MKKIAADGQLNLFYLGKQTETIVKDHEERFSVGDKVQVDYKGQKIGKVISIYNDGQTINVSWGKGFTAFYYKAVRRLKA